MLNSSFNSLSRSHTPSERYGSASRPTPSPKCFGKNTHVLKEDYERERQRWQQKLDEVEQKLNEASISNSELFQIKAELNRKIIDFEKNQRPLIEQNRRLNERIRSLNTEAKKLEEKISYSQDDYLSLKDAYDRLQKEKESLKEQRAFPEKLEELSRYRAQVLEYSKCITALRQSAVEKDQRYEQLVQRFKKLRKCLLLRKSPGDDEDRQSCIGSEGSEVDSGSIALDTIAEDLDEDVGLTAELLQPLMSSAEYSLKQQLELANMTILELRNTIESGDTEVSNKLSVTVNKLNEEMRGMNERRRTLEKELANAQEHNDLLEFQLVELTEGSQRRNVAFSDKQLSTELEFPVEDEQDIDIEPRNRASIPAEIVSETREKLYAFLAKNAAMFSRQDRKGLRNSVEVIDSLRNQLAFTETELNMSNCESNRVKRELEEELSELKVRLEESSKKHPKKKEMQQEIEQFKKERKEEAKRTGRTIEELSASLAEKEAEVAEKIACIQHLNRELSTSSEELNSLRSKSAEEQRVLEETRQRLERVEKELSTSKAELEAFTEQLCAARTNADGREKLIETLRSDMKTKTQRISESHDSKVAELKTRSSDLERELRASNEKLDEVRKNYEAAIKAKDDEKEELKKQIEKLLKDVTEADVQMQALRDQIRPIGSQLERRYEESRYRLNEALKKIYDLEEQLKSANTRIVHLESDDALESHILKIQQLQAYNHELEEQFNAQMDLITALKKQFIAMKGKTQSIDSVVGWAENGSEGTNSLDDEQYHSEGSERSLKATNL